MLFTKNLLQYFILLLFLFYITLLVYIKFRSGYPELDYVVVHIDLKGAPPKMKYLISLLKVFKYYGANAILIEYANMFPFKDKIMKLSSDHAYTREELTEFLNGAKEYELEVIPLVQTFGNMEYILDDWQYFDLRENITSIDSICPSKPESLEVIHDILQQIIHFHEEVMPLKYLHIGCNKTNHINECSSCHNRNLSDWNIFKEHVMEVTEIARNSQPEIKILIWDTTLRGKNSIDFKHLDVEPVVSNYGDVTFEIERSKLDNYQENFDGTWIASAFKGVDEPSGFFPFTSTRFRNNYSWMQFLRNFSGRRYNLKGIILTGQSRSNHTGPLRELLIPSIPSLIVNLFVIRAYKIDKQADFTEEWQDFIRKKLLNDLRDMLACDLIALFNTKDELHCSYPGYDVNEALMALYYVNTSISKFISEYKRVVELTTNYSLGDEYKNVIYQVQYYKSEVENVKMEILKTMSDYYPDFVSKEYIDQETKGLKGDLNKLLSELYSYEKDIVLQNTVVTNAPKIIS